MDQGAAPNTHARKPRFFRAPPPGSKAAASIRHLRSRLWLLLVLVAACAVYYYFLSSSGLLNWPVYSTYLDLQADGFRAGHTYLPLKPAPELLRAANPRDRVNMRYWALDLSYFEGKYYTYWGPVPALVQALVKSLLGITRTIGDAYISLVAACLNVWAGGLIIERMGRRLFGAVPKVVLVFGILAFACANPMLHNVTTAGTYVGAIVSAQAFLVLGVLFAFDVVWYAGTSSARRSRLLLTGFIWGLAIACRVTVMPTVAFLIAITALADAWLSERRWFNTFSSSLWLGLPVAAIGAALLVYNKVRFGDPLQFGLLLQVSGYLPIDSSLKYWIPNAYRYSLGSFAASCQFPYVFQTWHQPMSAPFPEGCSRCRSLGSALLRFGSCHVRPSSNYGATACTCGVCFRSARWPCSPPSLPSVCTGRPCATWVTSRRASCCSGFWARLRSEQAALACSLPSSRPPASPC